MLITTGLKNQGHIYVKFLNKIALCQCQKTLQTIIGRMWWFGHRSSNWSWRASSVDCLPPLTCHQFVVATASLDLWINCYCSAQIVPNSSMSVYKVFWLLTLWQFEIWYKNFFVCLVRKSWRHLWPNCVRSSSTDSNFKYFLFGWWMIDRTSLSQYYILWVWTLEGFWKCYFPHTPNKLGNF